MRTTHKSKHLVHANWEELQDKPHRSRRIRKHYDGQDQHHKSLAIERTPLKRSHSPLAFPVRVRKLRSFEMPPGASLLSVTAGPKLTKTGRVSKARKGLRGAHRCGCGKVSFYILIQHLVIFKVVLLYPLPIKHDLNLLHAFLITSTFASSAYIPYVPPFPRLT
jgi:hypothetical protein